MDIFKESSRLISNKQKLDSAEILLSQETFSFLEEEEIVLGETDTFSIFPNFLKYRELKNYAFLPEPIMPIMLLPGLDVYPQTVYFYRYLNTALTTLVSNIYINKGYSRVIEEYTKDKGKVANFNIGLEFKETDDVIQYNKEVVYRRNLLGCIRDYVNVLTALKDFVTFLEGRTGAELNKGKYKNERYLTYLYKRGLNDLSAENYPNNELIGIVGKRKKNKFYVTGSWESIFIGGVLNLREIRNLVTHRGEEWAMTLVHSMDFNDCQYILEFIREKTERILLLLLTYDISFSGERLLEEYLKGQFPEVKEKKSNPNFFSSKVYVNAIDPVYSSALSIETMDYIYIKSMGVTTEINNRRKTKITQDIDITYPGVTLHYGGTQFPLPTGEIIRLAKKDKKSLDLKLTPLQKVLRF